MTHSFITIAIPFDDKLANTVEAYLDQLGDPVNTTISAALNQAAFIHFMSITVVRGDANTKAHIVLEASADGTVEAVVERLAAAISAPLDQLLQKAAVPRKGAALGNFFFKHHLPVGQGWFSIPGVNFDGTPEMSVTRINKEADLAKTVSDILDGTSPTDSALATLESVRSKLWAAGSDKWAFVAEPAPCLQGMPSRWSSVLPVLWSATLVLLWPFLLVAIAVLLLAWYLGSFGTGLWLFAGVFLAEIGTAYVWLRRKEKSDQPDDTPPSADAVKEFMTRENYAVQNHLAAASTMKRGKFRRFTLRIGLWVAGQLALHFSRPSFLGPTGVIHFARWILLPGTDKLLFFSNYDGAWESYLENFIQQAYQGVTGIWSNTVGFPKTDNLFGLGTSKGAYDGDRLRRWTRRQQYVSRVWYTAYPYLTLARIRTNAAIRQGLALASTEAEASDWLSCFGSEPRPAALLAAPEIPTLVFGGLSRLRFATCLLLRLSPNAAANKAWLRGIESLLSYGDSLKASEAMQVGFSSEGLKKLGLQERHIGTFPVPFQHGSAAPWRARALCDTGANAPQNWWWGGPDKPIDAVILIFAENAQALTLLTGQQKRQFGSDITVVHVVPLEELPSGVVPPNNQFPTEPFGFADGISQPIIRGTPRAKSAKDQSQVVAPGEFVLGYPDNLGYIPPSPSVRADDDAENILPALGSDPFRQRPDFSVPPPTDNHDLGRNGTFLVVRQLEQDVADFKAFLSSAAAALAKNARVPAGLQVSLDEWIAAKMVGRWKDGTSLVRHPRAPGTAVSPAARPDNEFQFGVEDPTGLKCPFGAHIRRANPRDSFDPESPTPLSITNRHRILRVGRPYGPQGDNSHNPGLLFMCLNADIERQFEFVQQTWVLAPTFDGLQNEVDPILGPRFETGVFTIPTETGPLSIRGLEDFVTVRGSGYFFLPGKTTIRFLAQS